jgi:CubicO group peptidase (beta-lactamase class C family)
LVFGPLGLTRTVTLPEEALRFRTAWGHLPGPDGVPTLVDSWDFPRSSGPAGAIAASSRDLVTFARLFLEDGRNVDGERILSPELTAEMTRPRVAVPDRSIADHWGLGWALKDVGGRRIYQHGGNGSGQNALLRVVPDRGVAVAVLTNGGDQNELPGVLAEELLRELCDLEPEDEPRPTEGADAVADDAVTGVYERLGFRLDIAARDGALHGVLAIVEPLASQLPDFPPRALELHPSTAGSGIYVSRVEPDRKDWTPLVFVEIDGERYVHFGGRAMRKTA